MIRPFKNEAELSKWTIKQAHEYGWKVARFHRMPTPRGEQWRTPFGADGKGWLDLVLVRERIIFAELKMRYRKPDVDQQRWIDDLRAAGQEVYVWYDDQGELITSTLQKTLTPLKIARLTIATHGDIGHARSVAVGAPRDPSPRLASLGDEADDFALQEETE